MESESLGLSLIYYILNKHFVILRRDFSTDRGLKFYVFTEKKDIHKKFRDLYKDLAMEGFIPVLSRENHELIIKVYRKKKKKKKRTKLSLLLFFVTLLTTFYAGFFVSQRNSEVLSKLGVNVNPWMDGLLYMVSIMSVIGLHELGHTLACKAHNIKASLPMFIPGPPWFGTFGALISLEDPPVEKDQLFDLGISGPIVSFILSAVITYFGSTLSYLIPKETAQALMQQGKLSILMEPYLFDLIFNLALPIPPGKIAIIHPVALAGWIGMLITALNLLPIPPLDGGHIKHAVFGEKYKTLFTALSLILSFFISILMLLLLIFLLFQPYLGCLNNLSKPSNKRKAVSFLVPVMLILCFVPLTPI